MTSHFNMVSSKVNFNVNVDIPVEEVFHGCAVIAQLLARGTNLNDRKSPAGDRFISVMGADNTTYAAYYHPSKWHTVHYHGGNLPWDQTDASSRCGPGQWAVCHGQTRWSGNNKTWYEIED
jgi:hypothetical protein